MLRNYVSGVGHVEGGLGELSAKEGDTYTSLVYDELLV